MGLSINNRSVIIIFLYAIFVSRFAVRKGGSGTYDIKVSLLDGDKRDLPGTSFFWVNKRPPTDGSWERLGQTLTNYPPGLRFIRFEDSMNSLGWNGAPYDVKAFGATVKISVR